MYLGTSRGMSKKIAIIFIIIGIMLIPDVIAPTPFLDLIINVPLAFVFADLLGTTYLNAFVLTYVIGFVFILAGLLIYPYSTTRFANGRLKSGIRFMVQNPLIVVLALFGVILAYFFGQYLYDTLWVWARDTIAFAIGVN